MREYRQHAEPPQVGDWVNMRSKRATALCSKPLRVTRTTSQVFYYENQKGQKDYDYHSRILFIGTEAECQAAYDASFALATQLGNEQAEQLQAQVQRVEDLRRTLLGDKPSGGDKPLDGVLAML